MLSSGARVEPGLLLPSPGEEHLAICSSAYLHFSSPCLKIKSHRHEILIASTTSCRGSEAAKEFS